MTLGKMIDDNTHKGDAGIALIHRRVSQMKQVWHERTIDPGIDGTIELRDPATGEMSNQHIFVQSKASDRFPGETDTKFHYICKERDVDYWMKAGHNPVILICSHPETGEAWWAHVQSWFSDPARRATLRVDFDKSTQRFDKDTTPRLFAVADPHGKAHTPVADHRAETLVSNLMPVEFPDSFFSATASTSSVGAIFAAQRDSPYPVRSDFVLSHGRIYAWDEIAGTGLVRSITSGSSRTPVGELAAGNGDERRLFVRLLGAALQHDLSETCRWNNDRRFLHYRPTDDLSERKTLSASGHPRIAFKGYYQRKDDPSRKQFYRHAALRYTFTEIGGEWFVQLRPDYFFTSDGYKESPFADEYLSKLKRRERNPAVLGETQLWAGILQGDVEPTLMNHDGQDRILTFGPLVTFEADRGIDDQDWLPPAGAEENPDQMALDFEDLE
ncbi:DUF4365 domain-containing protein [Nocardioides soli]|uniref:DUF4365 domain-containing protein n=1 Tax=Nocardioides soli TaxID=1036020 RepID=A0A7W4Z147_9ACTN|nr:hypothetical protein [Nocardioides soli]